jgi:hypothetical protein
MWTALGRVASLMTVFGVERKNVRRRLKGGRWHRRLRR